MKYKIVDNFLPKNVFDPIKKIMMAEDFPWFFNSGISYSKQNKKDFYFTHNFYNINRIWSTYYDSVISPILEHMKIKSLIRVKGNLHVHRNKFEENLPHIDYNFKHNGALFYINTCNGYTKLFDNTKVNCVENRMLFFDPTKEHSSTNVTDDLRRVNININYF